MELTGKNVLVTGGNGFIGSHLVKYLVDNKIKVIVPYIEIDKRSYFHSNNLHKKTKFIRCDLRDFDQTLKLIKKHKVDFIFHLAAQALVGRALKNPLETFQSNVIGTVNILEAVRLYGKVRGVLIASSDKAYGKITRASEHDPIGGDHPYETSKSAADLVATTYFRTYRLPTVVTRFGNVYGEGDLNFTRIIPGIMKSLATKEILPVRSNGKYVRDYIYVDDIVDAMVILIKNIDRISGEAFNISSSQNLSVLRLIKTTEVILGMKIKYKILSTAVNEIPTQSINWRKIKKTLGWRPKNNLQKTIPEIYNWYESYFNVK